MPQAAATAAPAFPFSWPFCCFFFARAVLLDARIAIVATIRTRRDPSLIMRLASYFRRRPRASPEAWQDLTAIFHRGEMWLRRLPGLAGLGWIGALRSS